VAEPPRRELLRRINMLPEGTEFVIDLRADALDLVDGKPELRIVDADLKHVLTSWFSGGSWSCAASPGRRRRSSWRS